VSIRRARPFDQGRADGNAVEKVLSCANVVERNHCI